MLLKLGDSITTDHISPAGSIKADAPAGKYLAEHGVDRRDFNSYGSRRGNHEVMIRGTFANIRLRNQLAPGTEGGFTRDFTADDAPVTTVYEASEHYIAAGTPLVVLSGKEYGSGSSRDWAAKGTALLGVKAVIAESYERIHRSNLIGMGVLPLQYPEGQNAESLGPDRRGDVRDHRRHRAQRGTHAEDRQGDTPATSASTPSSGSTPPARPTTTATAASCSTCSGASSNSNHRPPGVLTRNTEKCLPSRLVLLERHLCQVTRRVEWSGSLRVTSGRRQRGARAAPRRCRSSADPGRRVPPEARPCSGRRRSWRPARAPWPQRTRRWR